MASLIPDCEFSFPEGCDVASVTLQNDMQLKKLDPAELKTLMKDTISCDPISLFSFPDWSFDYDIIDFSFSLDGSLLSGFDLNFDFPNFEFDTDLIKLALDGPAGLPCGWSAVAKEDTNKFQTDELQIAAINSLPEENPPVEGGGYRANPESLDWEWAEEGGWTSDDEDAYVWNGDPDNKQASDEFLATATVTMAEPPIAILCPAERADPAVKVDDCAFISSLMGDMNVPFEENGHIDFKQGVSATVANTAVAKRGKEALLNLDLDDYADDEVDGILGTFIEKDPTNSFQYLQDYFPDKISPSVLKSAVTNDGALLGSIPDGDTTDEMILLAISGSDGPVPFSSTATDSIKGINSRGEAISYANSLGVGALGSGDATGNSKLGSKGDNGQGGNGIGTGKHPWDLKNGTSDSGRGVNIRHLNPDRITSEMALTSVTNNSRALEYIPKKAQTFEIVDTAVGKNSDLKLLSFVDEKYQDDLLSKYF